MISNYDFLPGVPSDYVLSRLAKARGHEISHGKLASSNSSAALAVNTFAWFHGRPERLPSFPVLGPIPQSTVVEVEYCARFPWRGGEHPWVDAFAEGANAIVGIESKRFEPFRDRKKVDFSSAYDRPVWHDRMGPYEVMRDMLRSGSEHFEFLDAAQLVKHAFGLVTEGRRKSKKPHLMYLFAEPSECDGRRINDAEKRKHRDEIARFAQKVNGAEVVFGAISYREWLNSWPRGDPELARHHAAIIERFQP